MFVMRRVSMHLRALAAIAAVCVVSTQCPPASAEQLTNLPENLNLGSTRRTAEAPASLASPVTIINGGREREVTAGMRLTPAQALAVSQVLSTGVQSIVLGSRGRAVGGHADLTGVQNLASLTVPNGVSIIHDFGMAPPLELRGNLVNSGAIFAVSTNAAIDNAIVSANNIRNNVSGLITSILPATGLPSITNAISNLNLSLVATESIFNAGTISSARNLNLVAGQQIINAVQGTAPALLSALGNMNIATQSLANSGLIQASSNINVVEQVIRNAELSALSIQLQKSQSALSMLSTLQNLVVNNTGGVLDALNGSIVFDHSNAVAGTTLMVTGGDLLSQSVTANAGTGHLAFSVNRLPGTLHTFAGSATVGASTPMLTLEEVCIIGDPTFFNSGGSITLNTDLLPDNLVAILASQDVFLLDNFIRSRGLGGQGHNITIVAGAELIPTGGNSTTTITGPFGNLPQGQTIKVVGASNTGGSITCNGCIIDARSVASGLSGGNVVLAAYHDIDDTATGGDILLTGISQIDTSSGTSDNTTLGTPKTV